MLIAHVRFTVAPEDRARALEVLVAQAERVRAMDGCHAYVPFADGGDPGGLGVLHEWVNARAFDAYARSDAFQAVGAVVRPLMTEAPVSRRFDAVLRETVD